MPDIVNRGSSPNDPNADTLYDAFGKINTAFNSQYGSFGITVENSSSLTTGNKGYVVIPYEGTITGWTLIGDITGSVVVDVWKTSAGNIPTLANTITGSEKPTLSSQQINSDLSLSTWSTSVSLGDVVSFNIDSIDNLKRINLTVYITKQL